MASGNILAFGYLSAQYGLDMPLVSPTLGGKIGIGNIIQLAAKMSLHGFSGMGPIEAHLQITTPRNDRLRFVGIGLTGDVYLSVDQDTVSFQTDSAKPEYNPHPYCMVITDLDWLALNPQWPWKIYLRMGIADKPNLLYRYRQLAVQYGIEWKRIKHSIFIEGGFGLYKEKKNNLYPSGDAAFKQHYGWIAPGGRYRLLNRFSILGALRLTLYKRVKKRYPLSIEMVQAVLKLEAPIYFRESNTEAIRTLVFMERMEKKKDRQRARYAETENALPGFDMLHADSSSMEMNSFDFKKEDERLREKRKEVQEKMEKIERLLHDIEK
jgi:hypothetical protein